MKRRCDQCFHRASNHRTDGLCQSCGVSGACGNLAHVGITVQPWQRDFLMGYLGKAKAPRIYIAGPMTGIPDFNYPAFNAAEEQLRAAGYGVLNPARRGVREDWAYGDYLRHAIADVLQADAVAVLPDWMQSRGARLEVEVARTIGIPVLTLQQYRGTKPGSLRELMSERAPHDGTFTLRCNHIAISDPDHPRDPSKAFCPGCGRKAKYIDGHWRIPDDEGAE